MITALWFTIGAVCLVNLAFTLFAFHLLYRMVQRSLVALQDAQEGVLKALKGGNGIEMDGRV